MMADLWVVRAGGLTTFCRAWGDDGQQQMSILVRFTAHIVEICSIRRYALPAGATTAT